MVRVDSELRKDNKLTQSAFEVIESDDVKSEVVLDDPKSTEAKPEIITADTESGDSESTDDTADTSELPELIEIENPDEPKPKEKKPEEAIDETPTVPGRFELFEGSVFCLENSENHNFMSNHETKPKL